MNVTWSVSGAPEIQAMLAQVRERLENLSEPEQRSGILLLASGAGRIETGGDGSWSPTLEMSHGTPLNRTGELVRSLTRGASGNIFEMRTDGVTVGTDLEANGFNIGQMMQEGTGIYGSGQPITPKRSKFLVFDLNGTKVFPKSVKGSPPRPFLYITDDDADRIVAIFAAYLSGESES